MCGGMFSTRKTFVLTTNGTGCTDFACLKSIHIIQPESVTWQQVTRESRFNRVCPEHNPNLSGEQSGFVRNTIRACPEHNPGLTGTQFGPVRRITRVCPQHK